MKKIYLYLTAFLCAGISAKAQYFQHSYGSTDNEILSSGVNTVAQGQGHFMSGHGRLTCLAPLSLLPAAFTDVNGDVPGAPYFEKNFILSKINGQALHVNNSQAFEWDNGGGFGIIGSYIDFTQPSPGNGGIFYLQLDPSGNVINVFDYTLSNTNYTVGQVQGIGESVYTSNGGEVYVTGSAYGASSVYSYALKLDVGTGGMHWGVLYDIYPGTSYEAGSGVTESPYTPYSQNEIVVVGQAIDYNAGSNSDGFLMHINANSGALLAPVNLYGTNATDDVFNSVRVANNTAAGPAGFIIGGISSNDHWVVNTDASGNVNWSSTFDYSVTPGSFNECNDVIERFNTASKWEYYAVGTTANGWFGNMDIMVVKIDEQGNCISGGEFIYGNPDDDIGQMADQYNTAGTAPPDGLSVYGTSFTGTLTNMYHIKAYFNGLSGCNEKFPTATTVAGPGLLANQSANTLLNFNQGNLAALYIPFNDAVVCFSNTLTGGNNAKVAPPAKNEGDKAVLVMPNPAETGTRAVTVELESNEPGNAELTIVDMAGKQYYNGKVKLVQGKNSLPVDIGQVNMAPGMYSIIIKNGDKAQTKLLLVK